MSEEILNEIEETQTETEIFKLQQRVNHICVISKSVVKVEDINGKKHDLHMIETNSSWGSNPYGEDYAVVPDDMVQAILETRGFCDIVLNEDGTEVVEFTAREIPEIPTPDPVPTQEERIVVLEEQIASNEMLMIANYEAQEEINAQTENALIEIYEMMEV